MNAPLTKNQKLAFPEIEKSGAVVISDTPTYSKGTIIKPHKVIIERKIMNKNIIDIIYFSDDECVMTISFPYAWDDDGMTYIQDKINFIFTLRGK